MKRLQPLIKGLEAGVQWERRRKAFDPDAFKDFIVLILLIWDHLHVGGSTSDIEWDLEKGLPFRLKMQGKGYKLCFYDI